MTIVEVVRTEAEKFLSVGPDHPLWLDGETLIFCDASYVRLYPPANISETRMSYVKEAFREKGARVKVMPRQVKNDPVPVQARTPKKYRRPRETVLETIEESALPDKDPVKEACERIMDEVGL